MSAGKLAGKVALITGSSQGIGRATALAMAREGADIVVNGRSPKQSAKENSAEETKQEIEALGRRSLVCYADVGKREQVLAMFEQAVDFFGHVDIAPLVERAEVHACKRVRIRIAPGFVLAGGEENALGHAFSMTAS